MITTIATFTVFVEAQQRAKSFYTDMLGFALIKDAMLVDSEGKENALGQRA